MQFLDENISFDDRSRVVMRELVMSSLRIEYRWTCRWSCVIDDPKEVKKFWSLLTLPQLTKSKPNINIGIDLQWCVDANRHLVSLKKVLTQNHSAEHDIFENCTYPDSIHIPKRCSRPRLGMPVSTLSVIIPSNPHKVITEWLYSLYSKSY